MRKYLLYVIVFLLVTACGGKHDVATCHCSDCMDIKIGQMLVAGFKGVEPSDQIKEAITKYHIGGVIYFDADMSNEMQERNVRSPQQLADLSAKLQELSKEKPLFITIDQEGGIVNRLKTRYGFPHTVSAAYQGKVGNSDSTRIWAAATAQTLSQCGVNIDFAPNTDLASNPDNPIVAGKERAFSADADSVTAHSRVWIEELHKKKILTSIKHFPGHGSSREDSHLGLVDITNCWSDQELVPYRKLIGEGYADIVMVGHLVNKTIDTLPASLSRKTIQGILRDELGFKGVVSTDDMNMGAIVQNYSLEKALSLALNAGVNMIIMGNNAKIYEADLVPRSHGIIKKLVEQGEVTPELIDESYAKLMELKSRL